MMQISRRALLSGTAGLAVAAVGTGYWAFGAGSGAPRLLANLSDGMDDISGAGVTFSPDGKELAAPASPTVRRWDTATWRALTPLLTSDNSVYPHCCEYSPDGLVVAVGCEAVFVMDRGSGAVRQRVLPLAAAEQSAVFPAIAFSPDGRLLAAADGSGSVYVYSYAAGSLSEQPLTTLSANSGSQDGGQAVVFSPDSSLLAAAGLGGQVRLWDTATWKQTPVPTGGPGAPGGDQTMSTYCVSFSADGKYVAGSFTDVGIWNVSTGALEYSIDGLTPDGCQGLAFAGTSRVVVGDTDGAMALWDLTQQRTAATWSAGAPPLASIAVSPDGKMIAAGSDGECTVWATPGS